tara:strand:+ start:526 stop:1578 length:1053 start_codon:yes stop_codon:yes gene_type:complete
LKFGLFHSVQLPDPTAQQRYYSEALDQVIEAEQLGFDSVWFTEHHFTRHGIVSSTMAVLAYLAGLTSNIRLGTAVSVLPFHNPIKLAEEVATVDLLSNGRLDLGVGRGYQWGEYNRLNIAMDEADDRFDEAMDVMTKAWTSKAAFNHSGKFWTFNDMTVQPKPLQTPHPPVWVAASSHKSMDRVAKHDWNLMVGQGESFEKVGEQIEYYKIAIGEQGYDYDPARVTVARAMYTAPSREQVSNDAQLPFMWFKQTGQEVSSPPGQQVELLPENFSDYRRRYGSQSKIDYQSMADNVILFGTPDEISERIESLRKDGVENLILFVNYGGIESQKVVDSLTLFAKEVMPNFKS